MDKVDKEFVQSLEKGIVVLRTFTRERPSYTLAEMARAADLSRAAARRVVLTLQAMGYVGTDGREYFLLPKVLELGYAYLSSFGLTSVALPRLEALNAAIKEACSIGVLDEDMVVYVARSQGQRRMTMAMSLGSRLEATCTAVGRVLLAHLDDDELDRILAKAEFTPHTEHTVTDAETLRPLLAQVREQGWALVDQELEIGFRALSVPIRDSRGTVIAAINVGMHSDRVSLEDVHEVVLPQLLTAAAAISADFAAERPAV